MGEAEHNNVCVCVLLSGMHVLSFAETLAWRSIFLGHFFCSQFFSVMSWFTYTAFSFVRVRALRALERSTPAASLR